MSLWQGAARLVDNFNWPAFRAVALVSDDAAVVAGGLLVVGVDVGREGIVEV